VLHTNQARLGVLGVGLGLILARFLGRIHTYGRFYLFTAFNIGFRETRHTAYTLLMLEMKLIINATVIFPSFLFNCHFTSRQVKRTQLGPKIYI